MSINGYEYTKLNKEELNKISGLEKELNKSHQEAEIILLVFDKEN